LAGSNPGSRRLALMILTSGAETGNQVRECTVLYLVGCVKGRRREPAAWHILGESAGAPTKT